MALAEIKLSLRKPHFRWPDYTWPSADTLAALARITGTTSLSLEWAKSEQVQQTADLLAKSPATKLMVVCQAYQGMLKAGLPANDWGDVWLADIQRIRDRLKVLAPVAARVTHVLIDCENWHWRPGLDADGNPLPLDADLAAAHSAKFAVVNDLLRAAYPAAEQVVYGMRSVGPNAAEASGWWEMDYVPLGWPARYATCDLYYPELALCWEAYRRTQLAANGLEVIPFVGLGCTRRRGVDKSLLGTRPSMAWSDFGAPGMAAADLYRLGSSCDSKFWVDQDKQQAYPTSFAPFVCFWPGLGNPIAPGWLADFEAYCRGALAMTLPGAPSASAT